MPIVHWQDDVHVQIKLDGGDAAKELPSSNQPSTDESSPDHTAASHSSQNDTTQDAAFYNSLITWMRQAYPEKWDAGTGVYVYNPSLIIRWQVPRGKALA